MRKVVVSVLTSVDGFYEGPRKDLSQMPFEDAFNSHNLELLRKAGTLLYGSTWFAENWRFWSAVAADDAQSDRDHEIAEAVLTRDAVVISDTMVILPGDPWSATTRVVPRSAAEDEVRALASGDGGDILMFGSATTWNPLLAAGLVDEVIVLVGAALMGEGSKLYSGPRVGLSLLSARTLPDSQLVELRYAAGAEGSAGVAP
mgnify:CR=1 FL=1